MQRGIATFTLDFGHCPPWLFERMVKLGREMTRVLIEEYGPDEFIKRMADPVWFQSLGIVLAFDWNASGLTTILTAALKEAIRGQEKDWGIFICGGKGKTSRKTPDEIALWGERLNLAAPQTSGLIYNSKMSAKVDSSLVQDGYQIYHHSFFFSKNGAWTVVQQGMNTQNQTARRYHWFSENVEDLVVEPHSGIATQAPAQTVNLTSKRGGKNRDLSVDLISNGYQILQKDIQILRKHSSELSQMVTLSNNPGLKSKDSPGSQTGSQTGIESQGETLILLNLENTEFRHHPIEWEKFWDSPYLAKILAKLADHKPENYEKLLATEGVGPKTIRALALVAEVIYGAKPSYEDPARYSFAHGGKDATPYPVDRPTYDQSIEILRQVVSKSHLSPLEKDKTLKRLSGVA